MSHTDSYISPFSRILKDTHLYDVKVSRGLSFSWNQPFFWKTLLFVWGCLIPRTHENMSLIYYTTSWISNVLAFFFSFFLSLDFKLSISSFLLPPLRHTLQYSSAYNHRHTTCSGRRKLPQKKCWLCPFRRLALSGGDFARWTSSNVYSGSHNQHNQNRAYGHLKR